MAKVQTNDAIPNRKTGMKHPTRKLIFLGENMAKNTLSAVVRNFKRAHKYALTFSWQ